MLVLASSSPRRAALLQEWGYSFELIKPHVTERLPDGITPDEGVKLLAARKAEAGLALWLNTHTLYPNVLIGADTLVVLDDEALGKPRTEDEAFVMLKRLSGRTHHVLTGVALIGSGKKRELEAIKTEVRFRELSDAEIRDYIGTGEPLDKAGAYGIQGEASKFVTELKGSLTNVIGLPMEWLSERLSVWDCR